MSAEQRTDKKNYLPIKAELEKLGVSVTLFDAERHGDYKKLVRGPEGDPSIIIKPASQEELQQVIKLLNKHKSPAVIIAGRTGLVSAQRALGDAVIDVSGLNQLISVEFPIDETGRKLKHKFSDVDKTLNPIEQADIWREELIQFAQSNGIEASRGASFKAQAGVPIGTADHVLRGAGLMLPIEADSISIGGGATLGAAAANRMNGEEFRYGTSADQCLSATAVAGNGAIINSKKQPNLLDNAGAGEAGLRCDILSYNNSCIGSEGTYSIITEASFAAQPVPKQRHVFFIAAESAEQAIELRRQTLEQFPETARLELMNKYAFESVKELGGQKFNKNFFGTVGEGAPYLLYVDIQDSKPLPKEPGNDVGFRYYEHLAAAGLQESVHFQCEGDLLQGRVENIPPVRKCMTEISDMISGKDGRPTVEHRATFDIAVPAENLPEFEQKLKAIEEKYGVKAYQFGHFAKDAFHLHIHSESPLTPIKAAMSNDVFEAVYSVNGTCHTEHAVGQHNSDNWLTRTPPEQVAKWFAEKLEHDSGNILNPNSNRFSQLFKMLAEDKEFQIHMRATCGPLGLENAIEFIDSLANGRSSVGR